MPRIIIVDDHPVVRMGLREVIGAEPDLEVVGEAGSTSEALDVISATNPDLVVTDVSLTGSSGLELVKQLRAKDDSIKLLVMSMHDESMFADRALRAGATGFINKEAPPEVMLQAIRRVLSGKLYVSADAADRMLRAAAGDPGAAVSPVGSLSDRELEVFEWIGHGMPTRQIAEKLNVSVKTVESHRENIKKKLAVENNPELIRRAVQWVLQGD